MRAVTPRARRGRRPGAAPGDEGAAAVEFAIISVILLTLVFGILQYGFTFFQLTSAERTAAEAAHLVRTGQVETCDLWQADVVGLSTVIGLQPARSSWGPADPAVTQVSNGTRVLVTITWQPVNLTGGLVPTIGDGPVSNSVETTVTAVGENALYDGSAGAVGCPDSGAPSTP